MNIDEAIKLLENEGYEVRKRRKLTYDGSFLGIEMRGERLDSAAKDKMPESDLEQLRLDANLAREEMINKLSKSTNSQIDYSSKSTQALRDIAQANKDAANDRLV